MEQGKCKMLYFRVLFIVICFSCILWLGYMTMLLLALFVYCQKVAFMFLLSIQR